MKRSTWTIIGATLVAIGLGVIALGFAGQEADVRQVADVLGAPEAHTRGTYILIGIPQPETVPSENGHFANPARVNETRHVTAWGAGGTLMHSTHTLRVTLNEAGSQWAYRNETRQAGTPEVVSVQEANWTVRGVHTVFQIDGFPDANGDTPRVWGVYEGTLRDPIQPKPSQFSGRLATALDGAPLPAGARVFVVDEFTAGCSSKFLPDDHEPSTV